MGAETTTTIGMSLISGLGLFAGTVVVAYLSQTLNMSFSVLMWIVMPILAFSVAVAVNALTQKASCPDINIKKTFMNSVFNPIFALVFLVLAWFSVFRSPIEGILTFVQDPLTKQTVAYGYFMFWAGLFGEAIGAGMSQGC